MAGGALSHLRVLDLSRILAGPWAGQLLADLGADVIKVERPGRGDDTRSWGPPWLKNSDGEETADAAYYLCANRGKRSITLDLTSSEGQEIVRELAKRSDVLIENYKVGGLARYGLDYASLAPLNPRLIYCSITGFGQTGPYASRAGYDFMIQATGGVMSVTGERDDLPGGGPQKVGVAVSDLFTGMYSTVAIQAALLERERSGEGQYIDIALLDCQVAAMANQATNFLVSGKPPVRMGNAHPNIVPYQTFATADGHMIVAVGNDEQFQRLCKVLDLPALAEDPRCIRSADRVANRELVVDALAGPLQTHTTEYWLDTLNAATIPCGPINTLDQVFADPQVLHRQMLIETQHPGAGKVTLPGSPMKLSRTPPEIENAPPVLGQHTEEVLSELPGYDEERVQALRNAGVI